MSETLKHFRQALGKLDVVPVVHSRGRKRVYEVLGGTFIFPKWPSTATAIAFVSFQDDGIVAQDHGIDLVTALITAVTGVSDAKFAIRAALRIVLESSSLRTLIFNQHGVQLCPLMYSSTSYPGNPMRMVGVEVVKANSEGSVLFGHSRRKPKCKTAFKEFLKAR